MPAEGSPLIIGPNAMFKNAPNPNAARLFQSFCFTPECQQLIIDFGGLRSVHPQTKEKPGRRPFAEIKKMKDDSGRRSRRRARRSRRATASCSGCELGELAECAAHLAVGMVRQRGHGAWAILPTWRNPALRLRGHASVRHVREWEDNNA